MSLLQRLWGALGPRGALGPQGALGARPAGTTDSAAVGFNRLGQCRYGLMLFNSKDQYIGRALEYYGEYSQHEADLLVQFISPGAVVIDAGANLGGLTLFFARAVGGSGRVYAFEPQRVIFQTLCANMALNSLVNVYAVQAALGDRQGSINIDTPDYTRENNFGGMALGEWHAGEAVPLMRIDELALARCDLIKIDVEGMEEAVLRGAQATIARHRPLLYVENDRAEKVASLINCIAAMSYRMYWHFPPYFNPDNFHGRADNLFDTLASRNMLCLPAERALAVKGLEPVVVAD